jgi:hypothetical protein
MRLMAARAEAERRREAAVLHGRVRDGPADAAANGFGNPFYVGGGGLRDSAGEFNYETLEKARK